MAITSIYAHVSNLSEYLLLQSRAALQEMVWGRRRNDIIWLVTLLLLSAQEATEDSNGNMVEEFVCQMLSRYSKFVIVRCKVGRRLCTTGFTMTASQEVWRHIASYV